MLCFHVLVDLKISPRYYHGSLSSETDSSTRVVRSHHRLGSRERRARMPASSPWYMHRMLLTHNKSIKYKTSFSSDPQFRRPDTPVPLIVHQVSGMSRRFRSPCPGRAPSVPWSTLRRRDEASGSRKLQISCGARRYASTSVPAASCTRPKVRSSVIFDSLHERTLRTSHFPLRSMVYLA